jgi:hypothetical protein
MTTVNKASKEMNRLNTITLGGITSDKTTGTEPMAQIASGPVGPQLQVSPQAATNMSRIYGWKESYQEIKNMSQGDLTGKNYSAGQALANPAWATAIQAGTPPSSGYAPATLANTQMDASKITPSETKRGESVATQVNLGASIINNAKLGTGEYDVKAMTVANAVIQNLQGVASGALGVSKTVEKAGAAQKQASPFAFNLFANSPNTSVLTQAPVAADTPMAKAAPAIAKAATEIAKAAEKMAKSSEKISDNSGDKKSNRKPEGKGEDFAERQKALEKQKVIRTRDLDIARRRDAAAARAVEKQERKAKESEEKENAKKKRKEAAIARSPKKEHKEKEKGKEKVSEKGISKSSSKSSKLEDKGQKSLFSEKGISKSNRLEDKGQKSLFSKKGISKSNRLEERTTDSFWKPAQSLQPKVGEAFTKEEQREKQKVRDALVQQEKNKEMLRDYAKSRTQAPNEPSNKNQTSEQKQAEAITQGTSIANRVNDYFASSGNKDNLHLTVTVDQNGQLSYNLKQAAAVVKELAPVANIPKNN